MRSLLFLLSAPLILAQNLAQNAPPPIAVYLALTPRQTTEIARNLLDYGAYLNQAGKRSLTVWREIAEERRREPLDPLALGLRFAELVTIKRETAERERAVTARQLALLTPDQSTRLQNLIEADRLSNQLAPEAHRLLLMPVRFGLQPFPDLSLLPANVPPAPPRQPAARRAAEDPTSLERFLELSPEQITRYRANQDAYSSAVAPEHQTTAWSESCSALADSPLNPLRIGLAVARVYADLRAVRERGLTLVAANRALLTPPQLERLGLLEQASELWPVVSTAAAQGFLESAGGPGPFLFTLDVTPENGFRPTDLPIFTEPFYNLLDSTDCTGVPPR
ncbi:MAG: hypothetical protein ACK6DY_13975 [Acidobacteriota bacterium]